ncbi:hypothetical protein HPB51_022040 [Rhipicephalus microplus]|uniref:Uncharacterized protein n=1 Tax=Rhipicephalus microplus TaxID=6941 RepID=A0A9J6DWD8_RHIMP|nr:hypothetical protein HPB51_022040 [Rhipicephalus microplus]
MALLKFISSTSGSFLCSSYNPCSVAPLLIHANCQARSLSFFIRCKHLPDEVVRLFGGLAPSAGHGIRVLKILRSEWHRQARMLKDLLKTSLEDPGRTRHATREWKNLLAIVSSGTEFMWKQTLPRLRASIPKKTVPTTCSVRTTGQVSLPDYVENALKLGPKFAVEPRLSAPELLSLVRRISKCAPEGEANRCISEGVDVISRKNIGASRVPVSRVVSFLKQKRLCVLPADKEGGFVVLGEGDYDERACSAVAKVFNECNNVSLRKSEEGEVEARVQEGVVAAKALERVEIVGEIQAEQLTRLQYSLSY